MNFWKTTAKSVSGKWILLKFVRETWTKSPHLPSKVTLAQLSISFCVVTKTRNDLQPPTTMYNHLEKFSNHPQTIELIPT